MRLDGREGIQSVKSARPVLHAELKACVVTPLHENNKGRKTNTHTIWKLEIG